MYNTVVRFQSVFKEERVSVRGNERGEGSCNNFRIAGFSISIDRKKKSIYLSFFSGSTQFQPKSKRSPDFVKRLDTELRPNLYSIPTERHQPKKKRKI